MAADTDHHHAYCNHLSYPSSFSSDTQNHNQDVSISELIDHGSISFGRFAAEPLAWEKRSVFSHNRFQEELEKFKAPGIVAQKKAYFEEYYRKIRALKKMQSEEQEVSPQDIFEDNICTTSQVQNSVEITKSKEEKNADGTAHTKFSVDKTNAHQGPLEEGTTQNESLVTEKQIVNHNDEVTKRDQTSFNLVAADREDFSDNAALVPSSANTCIKSSQPDTLVSITVKLNASKPREHAPLSKPKGPVPSARDKTKFNTGTRKDSATLSEKGKSFSVEDTSDKANKSLGLSEKTTPRPGRNVKSQNFSSHRNPAKLRSSTTISHTSVPKQMPETSSSTKYNLTKSYVNSGLMNKSTSRHINITNGVNDAVGKRPPGGIAGKSLESISHFKTPKRGQSQNQEPKIMSMNRPYQTKPNQNLSNRFGLGDYVRAGKQIKETHAASVRVPTAASVRVPTAASSTPSGAKKATNPTVENKKIVPWRSGNLTHARREQRNKLPSWR